MALSRGFPPSNLIGAGVRIAEKDQSFITAEQSGHRAALIGFASKGPINLPTLISSSRQLHTVFGYPHPDTGDPYMLYAAEQFLSVANELFIVRVADVSPVSSNAAQTASVQVLTAGGAVEIEGNVSVGAGWSFDENKFFRWKLNGSLASKVLVVLADDNRPSPDTGNAYTADELVDSLNEQLDATIDGIEFYFTDEDSSGDPTATSKLGVRTTFAYGTSSSLELISVSSSLYGPSSVVGLGTLMTAASETGTATQYPASSVATPGIFDLTSFTSGTLNLQVVIDGTDNVLIDNVVQTIEIDSVSQSVAAFAADINDQIDLGTIPGGFVASAPYNVLTLTTLHSGRDAKLFIKPASTADGVFGLDNETHSGASPSASSGDGTTYTAGIVTGSTNDDSTVCFTVEADSPGIDGNFTQLVVTNNTSEGSFTLDVYAGTGSGVTQVESWGPLSKDPTSSLYVETFIASVSNYIRVIDNTNTLALPAGNTVASPYLLSGGSDGIPTDPDDQDELLIGNLQAMTGMQAISDPEQIDIDLVAVPGHTSTSVVLALLELCQETRQDCFAILDVPFGLTVREAVQWQNGSHPLNNVRFDNDFGALYWPWIKVRDPFNRVDVWMPPSGAILAAYARNDEIAGQWFAPAGTTRGFIGNILDVFSRPTLAERDDMQGNRNAVNPILQFPGLDGFFLWGQKTLQRLPTALDRVNVRRMMLYIEKRIRVNVRNLLFEPNDSILWRRFIDIAEQVIRPVVAARGINDYRIQCDAELNTPEVIDRNELRARIGIQPVRTAEFIFIEFSIHRTGSFSEGADNF